MEDLSSVRLTAHSLGGGSLLGTNIGISPEDVLEIALRRGVDSSLTGAVQSSAKLAFNVPV